MSSQQDQDACGAHKLGEAIPGSYFDYTCDDCMLPFNHYDPPEINDLIVSDDSKDDEKRNKKGQEPSETVPF